MQAIRLGVFLIALCALGVGLYWILPAAPRFDIRRHDFVADGLSADGTFVVGGFYSKETGSERRASIRTIDAKTGIEQGEFFRGLVGTDTVSLIGGPVGLIGDPDEVGFSHSQMQYSKDRRYCALIHRQGLALADMSEGREWPTAIPLPVAVEADAEAARNFRRLRKVMRTEGFRKKLKWKDAIATFQDAVGSDLNVVIDREALIAGMGKGPTSMKQKFPC